MKKVNKKLLALLMSATLVTAGAGAFVAFSGVSENASVTASAEITTDRTESCKMNVVGSTGDYADAASFRILMSSNDETASWGKNTCLNDGNYQELLKYITFNGKSIHDYREEYKALIESGAESPITWETKMQSNIADDVSKNRAIYAPIFVNVTYHASLGGDAIDVYVPTSFLAPSDITQMGIKAGFELNGYGVSQDVTFYFNGCVGRADQVDKVVGEVTPYKTTATDVNKLEMAMADNFMIIYLTENDYAGTNTTAIKRTSLSTLNLYNYIEVNGKKLHSYMETALGQPFFQVWNRTGSIAFNYPSVLQQNEDSIQEIKFLAGCQFPSYAYDSGTGEKMCYQLGKDVTFVRVGDTFVNEETLMKADEISISDATIAGEAGELYAVNITCDKWSFSGDAYNYNYFGSQYQAMRKSIFINGVSLWDINTTVDDSAYVYSTSPFTNDMIDPSFGTGEQVFQNPTMLYGEEGGNTLTVWIHKQYIEDTNANEIEVKLAYGYMHSSSDVALGEDVTATVWKKPINVTIDGVAQEGLVYGDKVAKPEDPTKEEAGYNYTFDNWYVAGTDTVYDFDAALEADVAIESRFNKEAIVYTVAFTHPKTGMIIAAPIEYTVENMSEVVFPEVPAEYLMEGYTVVWDKTPADLAIGGLNVTLSMTANEYTYTFVIDPTDRMNGAQFVTAAYGSELTMADPVAEGKEFLGWVDLEGNAVTLPETMPVDGGTVYASWKINKYSLTIVNGEESKVITFGVVAEPNDGVEADIKSLAFILSGELPAENDSYTYAWDQDVPETFELQDYNFTVVATPKFVDVTLDLGENTVEIPAGKYAVSTVYAMGEYTVSWTGDASVTLNGEAVESGSVVAINPRGAYVVITPNGDEACTVVMTITAYVAPVPELVLGENAINVTVEDFYCAGTEVEFTAVEAGKYVLKVAEGEENADVTLITENSAEWIEVMPYEFELEAGATIKFVIATTAIMTLTEDEINLVLEKVEAEVPGDSEEPEVPGDSEEPEVPGDSEEPEVPGESDEPEVPGDSDEPEQPSASEEDKKKKGGCGSSVALGMVGALTVAGAALIIKKRKED